MGMRTRKEIYAEVKELKSKKVKLKAEVCNFRAKAFSRDAINDLEKQRNLLDKVRELAEDYIQADSDLMACYNELIVRDFYEAKEVEA